MSAIPFERAVLYTVTSKDDGEGDQLAWHSGQPSSPEEAILIDLRWMFLPEMGVEARTPLEAIERACPITVQAWVRDTVPSQWSERVAEHLVNEFVDRFQADWGDPNGGDDGLTPAWRAEAGKQLSAWVQDQVAHGRVWPLVRSLTRQYSAAEVQAIVRERAPDLLEPSEPLAGREALSRWLAFHGVPQAVCALAIGVSQAAVSDWSRGKKVPEARYRNAIERWTSGAVPASSWLPAEERAELERLENLEPYKPRSRNVEEDREEPTK